MKDIDISRALLIRHDDLVKAGEALTKSGQWWVRRTTAKRQMEDEQCLYYAHINSRTTEFLLVRER